VARIPTAANVGQAPSPRDPGVSVPAVGQEIARGIQDIGRGLGVIAEKQQIAEDRRFLADYDSEVRTRAAEAVLGLDGQQESSTYASQVEQAVGQLGPLILKDFESRGYTPSQDARTRADVGFTGLLTNTRVSAITDQHNAKVAAALRGIQNNADVQLNLLVDRPSRENLTAVQASLRETFDQAEGMANPDVLARMRDKYEGEAFKSYVGGLIGQEQFGAARRELATAEANDLLDPSDKQRLTHALQVGERAYVRERETDVVRELRDASEVAGQTTPDMSEVDAAIAKLPPSLQTKYRAKATAIADVGRRNLGYSNLPASEREAALAAADAALLRGNATIEQKEYRDTLDRLNKAADDRNAFDASISAAGAGAATLPSGAPTWAEPASVASALQATNDTALYFGDEPVQPMPRALYDLTVQALTSGTDQEKEAAVTALGSLEPRALGLVYNAMGKDVSPALKTAVGMASSQPDVARDIVAASGVELKSVPLPTKEVQANVAAEVAGNAYATAPGLRDQHIAAALQLTAKGVSDGTVAPNKADDAFKENFERVVGGSLTQINGGTIILPNNVVDGKDDSVGSFVEDRMKRYLMDDFGSVVVPLNPGTSDPISVPPEWKFGGLVYQHRGEETPVPEERVANGTWDAQVAPGVYVPHVDGGRGKAPALAKYTTPDGAVLYFKAGVSLDRIMATEPSLAPAAGRGNIQRRQAETPEGPPPVTEPSRGTGRGNLR
jgi:hypothetical protein